MVIKKVHVDETQNLPAGHFIVDFDEHTGQHKVPKEMTGERFIKNLEQVNKKRVEKQEQLDQPDHVQGIL